MFKPGDVISYIDMCVEEGTSLQRGMNFRLNPDYSVVLMSVRSGAPYADRVEEDGSVLIYEGHDIPKQKNGPEPKTVDQPLRYSGGSLTQNGLFFEAVNRCKEGHPAELVRVYEKIQNGIWVYNGIFELVDAWQERQAQRAVFKFKLRIKDQTDLMEMRELDLEHSRFIPTSVKLEVWKRDQGRCVVCGSDKNLHYDHIIPYSKGGTSLSSETYSCCV